MTDPVDAMIEKATAKKLNDAVVESSDDERIGTPPAPDTAERTSRAQADALPGTHRFDMLYIPDKVYDENMNQERECADRRRNAYHWVTDGPNGKVTKFKAMGYRHVLYTGGNNSGLQDGGFEGTGMYERDPYNHVRNGDLVLMWTPIRNVEAIAQAEQEYGERLYKAATEDFHNQGYRMGVRTFVETDGEQSDPDRRVYN